MLENIRDYIKKDQETKDLSVSDVDLLIVYNYLLQRDGLSENKIPDGYKIILKSEPYYRTVLIPTLEKKKELENIGIRRMIDTLGTDNYILDVQLDDFKLFTDERKAAYSYANEFIESFQNKQIKKGMLLVGKYRTGKSYLMSAIANALSKIGAAVLFVYFPDFTRVMKDSIADNSVEEKVTALKKCAILMLDDLGAENMTPWLRDDILGPILQYRLAADLPVFISTNFTSKELIEMLASSKLEVDRVKAGRIVTRIMELTAVFPLSEAMK